MQMTAANGKVRPLTLEGGAVPIRYLDGHLVELDGTLRRGAIDVDGWRVVEGLHGLPAWVGVVRQHPRGLALFLPDVGLWYALLVEEDSEIHNWVGRPLLVEGFLEGSDVRVVYYRPLFDEGRP